MLKVVVVPGQSDVLPVIPPVSPAIVIVAVLCAEQVNPGTLAVAVYTVVAAGLAYTVLVGVPAT